MKVREELEKEMKRLVQDLIGKIDFEQDKVKVIDVFDYAIKNNIFNPKEYIYSQDEEYLLNMLNFSMPLSKLWIEHKKKNPTAPYSDVNEIIFEYIKHMWGYEEIPTMESGDLIKKWKI